MNDISNHFANDTKPMPTPPDVLQDVDGFRILMTILFGLVVSVSFLGTVTNIMNMIVFRNLFLLDPVNLNFFCLSMSDLGICFTALVLMIGGSPWLARTFFTRYRIFSVEFWYMVSGVPHNLFVRITILLTALIASDRGLCVVMPIKARILITRRKISWLIVVCYALGLLSAIPVFYLNRLEWVYLPYVNNTYLRQITVDDFHSINAWFTPIDTFFLQIVPCAVIFIWTAVMISNLRKRSLLRQNAFPGTATRRQMARERRIMKVVVIVSIEFLICHLHNAVAFMVKAFDFDLNMNEVNNNELVYIFGALDLALDSINAFLNFFIYYNNSTKYKRMFDATFLKQRV